MSFLIQRQPFNAVTNLFQLFSTGITINPAIAVVKIYLGNIFWQLADGRKERRLSVQIGFLSLLRAVWLARCR